jgi:hypothetical protein
MPTRISWQTTSPNMEPFNRVVAIAIIAFIILSVLLLFIPQYSSLLVGVALLVGIIVVVILLMPVVV